VIYVIFYRMFVQYVDHGIIQLTGDFMAHLITGLSSFDWLNLILQCRISHRCFYIWTEIWYSNNVSL